MDTAVTCEVLPKDPSRRGWGGGGRKGEGGNRGRVGGRGGGELFGSYEGQKLRLGGSTHTHI